MCFSGVIPGSIAPCSWSVPDEHLAVPARMDRRARFQIPAIQRTQRKRLPMEEFMDFEEA